MRWGGDGVVAIVAHRFIAIAMERHRQIAIGTHHDMTTCGALDRRRKTSAVEQQDDLAILFENAGHGLSERPRDARAINLDPIHTEIDRSHLGHRAIENAARQADQMIRTGFGALVRFQGRSRRAQNEGHFLEAGPMERHIASMVSRDSLLFKGRLVLFIEDHQTELRDWCKDGAARPYDNLNIATGDTPPLKMPLWSAHVGVEDRDTTESIFESASGLRCQTDFRHEDDRLTTETDRPLDRLHVDFGLTTPRHTVQEYRRMLP
jgi:hypothetical protein